jgi:hypothetical protein
MDKLNLPIINEPIPEPKPLLMDEYLEFVMFNLKYTVDSEVNKDWRKALFVNVPFHLSN